MRSVLVAERIFHIYPATMIETLLQKYTAGNPELYRTLKGHSAAVRDLALSIATRHNLQIDTEFVNEAAMLHDIGIVMCDAPGISCFGTEPYLRHGIEGARILRAEGLPRHARVAERHTGAGITAQEVVEGEMPLPVADYLPETLEEKLICFADKFYSKSRDLRGVKPIEKIRMQMQAHGAGSGERFAALEALFGNPFE